MNAATGMEAMDDLRFVPAVRLFLDAARENFDLIDSSGDTETKARRAVAVSLFAAAAVEAALTAFVMVPAQLRPDTGELLYDVVTEGRVGVRALLTVAQHHSATLIGKKKLVAEVHGLLNFRNELMHATPEWLGWMEARSFDQARYPGAHVIWAPALTEPVTPPDYVPEGALIFKHPGREAIEHAEGHLSVAERFVDSLTLDVRRRRR